MLPGLVRGADCTSLDTLAWMTGQLYYIAKVAHNALPVAFALTECGEHSAVFENPDHDFPTRIAYQLTDAGQMVVDVRGPDGKGFSILFDAVAAHE